MTPTKTKEKKAVDWQAYVDQLRPILRLADWEIRVSGSVAGDGNLADINPTYGQKRAALSLSAGFDEESPEEQRQTIAHELIHCHLWPVTEMAVDDTNHFMSSGEREMFNRGFKRCIEYSVDALADSIAPFLPLPE